MMVLELRNSVPGIKRSVKKNKKNLVIFGKSHFFGRKSLNWSNLVKTYRNSLLLFFEKHSKFNKELEYDA
jgi:hypothetical protein